MSTSRHINKICIVAVVITIALTILFIFGDSIGITAESKTPKYENTLFDTSYVHKIDIVMDDWDSFIENCENEEYADCTVVVDGKKYSNTAIRAKGNTSLSSVKNLGSQRYSFKLEFDHYETAKMLDGLDKLCLNNLIQDNTMMKDYLAYRLMGDFGVDSPLCSYAYLTVNGEDWGLYLAVEGVEDSFLSRNYGTEIGDLYKPDSMSFGGGRGNGKDFRMSEMNFDNGEDSDESEAKENVSDKDEGNPETDSDAASSSDDGIQDGGFNPGSFDFSNFNPGENFNPGDFDPDSSDSTGSGSDTSDTSTTSNTSNTSDRSESGNSGRRPGGMPFGGGMGMGSSDVKLQYIDDDADSYSNIFDSAKTDVSDSDKTRLIESLKKLSSYSDLEVVLDMDEVLRYFVVHNFLCNGDSYTGMMIHNYYLHENDGKLSMIPWDYNLAFGTFQSSDASSSVNASIDSPVSGNVDDRPMVGWIFSDEKYTEQYHELFSEFIKKWFTNGELEQLISDTAEMLRPYVEKDTTKFCTLEEFDKGVEAIKQFVALRGEAVNLQLEGDGTPVDTGSLEISAMGTMGGGMGGPGNRGGNIPDNMPGNMPDKMPDDIGENMPSNMPDTVPSLPDQSEEADSSPQTASNHENETDSQNNDDQESSTQGTTVQDNSVQDSNDQDKNVQDNRRQPSFGREGFTPPEGISFDQQRESSEQSMPFLIGISVLILAVGLVIAIKMKSNVN